MSGNSKNLHLRDKHERYQRDHIVSFGIFSGHLRFYVGLSGNYYMGEIMNSIRTLETSLIWQRFILNKTTDPKQRERAKRAIAKLEEELQHALTYKH